MKKLQYILLMGILLLGFSSCSKDGDFLTTSGSSDVTLMGGAGDLVLQLENRDALAMTLYWTENGTISLSNPLVAAPNNAITNTIQFSGSENFATVVENEMDKGVFEKQYLVSELNGIVSKLAFAGNVSTPLYIRIKYSIGTNIDAKYSDIIKVNVTPYVIDMTKGYVLDSKKEDTGNYLYSPTSDGIYKGFIGAGSWYNFYMREGDGTLWGNLGEDGKAFYADKSSSIWNFWYPGFSGCYYTIVDTKKSQWSALYVSDLTVSGDIAGEMTYNRPENKWTLDFDATKTGSYTIKIAGNGKLYDVTTSTDDAAAIAKTVGFSGNSDNLEFGESATTFTVNVENTGNVTLILDLSKADKFTCAPGEASAPVEVSKYLWMSGLKEWDFNSYLRLYNEDDMAYAGVADINSEWGYQFYTEKDNWDSAYGMVAGGSAYEGKLVAGGTENVTPPTAGLYLMNVSMKNLTYNLVAVTGVQYAELNDDWAMADMTATATPGEYTAAITINKASEWGFKIYLNGSWDYFFGGSAGELFLNANGITDDATLAAGNYTLTVNLCTGTYSIN